MDIYYLAIYLHTDGIVCMNIYYISMSVFICSYIYIYGPGIHKKKWALGDKPSLVYCSTIMLCCSLKKDMIGVIHLLASAALKPLHLWWLLLLPLPCCTCCCRCCRCCRLSGSSSRAPPLSPLSIDRPDKKQTKIKNKLGRRKKTRFGSRLGSQPMMGDSWYGALHKTATKKTRGGGTNETNKTNRNEMTWHEMKWSHTTIIRRGGKNYHNYKNINCARLPCPSSMLATAVRVLYLLLIRTIDTPRLRAQGEKRVSTLRAASRTVMTAIFQVGQASRDGWWDSTYRLPPIYIFTK